MNKYSFVPGQEQPSVLRGQEPRPADAGCFQCGEPLSHPDEMICTRCTEEILQSEIHQ